MISRIAAQDKSSTTGINLAKIAKETSLNPWIATPTAVREALWEREETVPERDKWRLPYLDKLLRRRYELQVDCQKTTAINILIDSLCSS